MRRLTAVLLGMGFGSLWVVGCSGDASLGGNTKEQGVNPEGATTADGSTSAGGTFATSSGDSDGADTTGTAPGAGGAVSTTGADDSSAGGSSAGGSSAGGSSAGGSGATSGGGATTDGSAGTAGTDSATSSTAAGGTTGGPDCTTINCLRPYECVAECGGPVLQSGCCLCEEGTIDRVTECESTTGATSTTGGLCVDGETMVDDCNTCTCVAGTWACTERACEGTPCGGFAGNTCSEDEYCAYMPGQYCGAADASAFCQPRPEGCTADWNPVCGCDGQTHSNACMAAAAGTGVHSEGSCAEE